MSDNDDNLIENFASDDPALDLRTSCYAVSDSLAYDEEASFLCFNLKTIARLRGIRGFDAQKFGAALFECFGQPDIRSEIVELQSSQRQIAVVAVENRETGVSPPDSVMAKIPVAIGQGLESLGLCFDVVPQRPSISRLFDNDFTGELH
jgi:hypothetical protein